MTAPSITDIPADVFTDVVGRALLANGTAAMILPAASRDLNSVREFYQELSDTSSYYRFFGIRRAIPDSELRDVVSTCLPGHIALLAFVDERLIGIGEYIADRIDTCKAEVAFAVADDHHHEGVATVLLERLATIAHRCGLVSLTAVVLPGNSDMQLVFRTVGLPVHSRFDGAGGVVDITLDITDLRHLRDMSEQRHASVVSRTAGTSQQVAPLHAQDLHWQKPAASNGS